jgi:hypothetical protein
VRLILWLGLALLVWGLAALLSSPRSEPRREAEAEDFSLMIEEELPPIVRALVLSRAEAIVVTSAGASSLLLFFVAYRVREGPLPGPSGWRRDAPGPEPGRLRR